MHYAVYYSVYSVFLFYQRFIYSIYNLIPTYNQKYNIWNKNIQFLKTKPNRREQNKKNGNLKNILTQDT